MKTAAFAVIVFATLVRVAAADDATFSRKDCRAQCESLARPCMERSIGKGAVVDCRLRALHCRQSCYALLEEASPPQATIAWARLVAWTALQVFSFIR